MSILGEGDLGAVTLTKVLQVDGLMRRWWFFSAAMSEAPNFFSFFSGKCAAGSWLV